MYLARWLRGRRGKPVAEDNPPTDLNEMLAHCG